MLEEQVNRPSRWRIFWPAVNDVAGAKEAINLSSWLALLAAAVNAVVGVLTASPAVVTDAVWLAFLGLGIRQGWRWAAVVGLLSVSVGLLMTLSRGGLPGALGFFLVIGMVNGVRGTFALKRLPAAAEPAAEG